MISSWSSLSSIPCRLRICSMFSIAIEEARSIGAGGAGGFLMEAVWCVIGGGLCADRDGIRPVTRLMSAETWGEHPKVGKAPMVVGQQAHCRPRLLADKANESAPAE